MCSLQYEYVFCTDDLLVVGELDDAAVGLQSGEREGRDARRGARECAQQRRLARVGQPDEPDVRHEPQLEIQRALLALRACRKCSVVCSEVIFRRAARTDNER